MSQGTYDRFWGLLLIASVVFGFAYWIHLENKAYRESLSQQPSDQQLEAYKQKLYTVVTREGTYKDLKRAGSGDYETLEGKRIGFHEPYTEFEQ